MPNQKELNSKYLSNLSVTSNDPDIIRRDLSGNMVVVPDNGTIYIEPVTWVYDNNSINKIIDTRFSYYKFPPRLIIDDADVPDDTTLDDIRISFSARYKAEPQLIPTIQMLLIYGKTAAGYNQSSINYGWNQLIDEAEFNDLRAKDFYNPVVWDYEFYDAAEKIKKGSGWEKAQRKWNSARTRLRVPPEGGYSAQGQASKYFQAQEVAREELRNGTSLGRYEPGSFGGYTSKSLIEGHFRRIKFTEILEGLPQAQPGCFVINKDIIDSKKSFEFRIQVAVSHLDNAGHNTFMIRLVRNTSVSSPEQPYTVLKTVSSLEQGAAAINNSDVNQLQKLVAEKDDNLIQINKLYISIDDRQKDINKRMSALTDNANKGGIKPLLKAVEAVTGYNVSKPKVFGEVKDDIVRLWEEQQRTWYGLIARYKNRNKEIDDQYRVLNDSLPIDPTDPEDVLNAQYSFLWPGKTYFTLNYILNSEDIKLNDIYSVEMLACDPNSIAHELIEENTYWDIREMDIESETLKPTSTIYYKGIELPSDVYDIQPGAKGPTVLSESDLDTYANQSIETNQTSGTTVIVPLGGTKVLPSSKKFNEIPIDTKQSAKEY